MHWQGQAAAFNPLQDPAGSAPACQLTSARCRQRPRPGRRHRLGTGGRGTAAWSGRAADGKAGSRQRGRSGRWHGGGCRCRRAGDAPLSSWTPRRACCHAAGQARRQTAEPHGQRAAESGPFLPLVRHPLTPAPRSATRLASMVSCLVMRYSPGGTATATPLPVAAAWAEALAMAARNATVSSAGQARAVREKCSAVGAWHGYMAAVLSEPAAANYGPVVPAYASAPVFPSPLAPKSFTSSAAG